ncbi:sigma-70 family RNA polymerase sigma factor [Nonomuraea sp. KC401]|uniref:sigma-70 family RNA polymerase sigma factor n=1 Tax=unclassified Nonomuraea TaxID=2593643 RepID=UPI0010FE0510|nr:sigma-70 family RNA polymerase sigma factor [Nonomuraea sp. KC401]NBE94940.1 sigma-70 family RNA polymerase sigma factor [Nonomuraea sp. K271]TLF74667.1 sigma-70 family RNA polymerase sigma factor [Nonomuraea sp. KC401]
MDADEFLAGRFAEHRDHMKAVAYRMLGSLTEADDAVQEAWLRLSRTDSGAIGNLGGWLTTVVGRVCLDMLRARAARREAPLEQRLPDPVVSPEDGGDPEREALTADAVGLALLVVLDSLRPAERLAFVLHDMFAVPYEQIATVVDRSPDTARKLASRARRRVRGTIPSPDPDPARQRRVVDAFLSAARDGDFAALLTVLDPDVVLRIDAGAFAEGGSWTISGAAAVAGRAPDFQRFTTTRTLEPVLVNGAAGLISSEDGRPRSVLGFTIAEGRIAAIDILSDPDRVARLTLTWPQG